MKKSTKIIVFFLSCLVCIAGDRITKDLAKQYLKDQPSHSYWNNTFRLDYVENTGAALSMGDDLNKTVSLWLLSILPLVILLWLLYYTLKHIEEMRMMKMISIALVFSGGIGNIIDRLIFDRHVTDFMNAGIGDIRTGIFNVADVCVTAGVIGLLLFFNDKKTTPGSVAADQVNLQ